MRGTADVQSMRVTHGAVAGPTPHGRMVCFDMLVQVELGRPDAVHDCCTIWGAQYVATRTRTQKPRTQTSTSTGTQTGGTHPFVGALAESIHSPLVTLFIGHCCALAW